MSTQHKGLGRGLNALFDNSPPVTEAPAPEQTENGGQQIMILPLVNIVANPQQPRQVFNEAGIAELAQSIKTQGLIQPIIVRPAPRGNGYQIVAGERRYRAATMAGLTEVPVVVHDYSDDEVMLAALIENLQREDLNPVEEARAISALRDKLAITQEELASRLGKSRSAVANALRLLQLDSAALQDIEQGRLSAGHARALLSIEDPAAREELRLAVLIHSLPVRDTEEAVTHWKQHGVFPWHQGTPSAVPQQVRRKKTEQVKEIQSRLNHTLDCKTRISGSEEKGKISLSYTSAEQFHQLLTLLGVADSEEADPGEEQSAKDI